jgi:hypothetical protein
VGGNGGVKWRPAEVLVPNGNFSDGNLRVCGLVSGCEADLSFLIGENADETRPFQFGRLGMLPSMHNLWYMYDGRYRDGSE